MKLLLWACIVWVAFAKRRFLSSSEEDNGNHLYRLYPSLNAPYEPRISYLPPPNYDSQNNVHYYPEFANPEEEVPSFPWVLTAPRVPAFHANPNVLPDTWVIHLPPPPLLAVPSFFVPASGNPEASAAPAAQTPEAFAAPAAQTLSEEPPAANPAIVEPVVTDFAAPIPSEFAPAAPESQLPVA